MVKIKGHEIGSIIVKSASNRRAMQFKNNIITVLRSMGVNENDIDIPLESVAMKKARASATWYLSGYRMHYSHNLQSKYVENLHVLLKVIEMEANLVISETKTLDDFILEFREESDVDKSAKRRESFLAVTMMRPILRSFIQNTKRWQKNCIRICQLEILRNSRS